MRILFYANVIFAMTNLYLGFAEGSIINFLIGLLNTYGAFSCYDKLQEKQ